MYIIAHYGAVCFGSDVDCATVISEGQSIMRTFKNLNLVPPQLFASCVSSLAFCESAVDECLIDSIICDPPYGIRAKIGGTKSSRSGDVFATGNAETDPMNGTCSLPIEVYVKLLEYARRNLRAGGRLVYWKMIEFEKYMQADCAVVQSDVDGENMPLTGASSTGSAAAEQNMRVVQSKVSAELKNFLHDKCGGDLQLVSVSLLQDGGREISAGSWGRALITVVKNCRTQEKTYRSDHYRTSCHTLKDSDLTWRPMDENRCQGTCSCDDLRILLTGKTSIG